MQQPITHLKVAVKEIKAPPRHGLGISLDGCIMRQHLGPPSLGRGCRPGLLAITVLASCRTASLLPAGWHRSACLRLALLGGLLHRHPGGRGPLCCSAALARLPPCGGVVGVMQGSCSC